MSQNNLVYDLDLKHLEHLKAFENSNCHTCGLDFKLGDKVLSKKSNRGHRPIRHYECARRVNLV